MPLPVKDVLKMIADNTKKYGMPFPIPKEVIYKWTEGLDLPKGGDTVLFTGLLYQMIPYINTSIKYLESVEESKYLSVLMRAGGIVNVMSKLLLRVSEEELKEQYEVLRGIARLLKKIGVQFGYLYENDMYSGVLLYDMGLDDDFREHAMMVYDKLKSLGVKTLITIDPHTTYMMREVYKNVIPGYDLTVKNYLEILVNSSINSTKILKTNVTLHDPCYYTRYLKIIDEPRRLLEKGGISIIEPDRNRELTFCCGGPIESITPGLSKRVAQLRISELSTANKNIITMCPICYANLSRVKSRDIVIKDISHYLYTIYG
ncbi:MAG: (Fe-S)-binding protein [Thermoprotei archaeon]